MLQIQKKCNQKMMNSLKIRIFLLVLGCKFEGIVSSLAFRVSNLTKLYSVLQSQWTLIPDGGIFDWLIGPGFREKN